MREDALVEGGGAGDTPSAGGRAEASGEIAGDAGRSGLGVESGGGGIALNGRGRSVSDVGGSLGDDARGRREEVAGWAGVIGVADAVGANVGGWRFWRIRNSGARIALGLTGLAALWGGSFLFMRVAAPEFGPVPLIGLRVAIGAVMMGAMLAWRGGGAGEMRGRVWALAVTGVFNSALPFSLLATATLSVTAGFASILNATSPFFAALVAWVWLGERLTWRRTAGLAIGFGGVVMLVWGKASFKAGGSGWAIAAGLGASLSYGFAANYTRRALAGMSTLAIGTGSLIAAAVALAPVVVWRWPATMPTMKAWGALLMLAVFCTGVAYLIYFRLLERIGAARTVSVTFLIPIFAMGLGWIFLGEGVTWRMAVGAGVVILGTSMTSGGGDKTRMTKPEIRIKSE